jgi:2'-5' RNA ligase
LHVTLLFPFVPRADLNDDVFRALTEFFDARAPFTLRLGDIGEFPGVVYAVPEPDGELKEWIAGLWERFPDFPPYGGQFADLVPHATLGTWHDPRRQEELVARGRELTRGMLPLTCVIEDVALLEEHAPDRWRELRRFRLGVS